MTRGSGVCSGEVLSAADDVLECTDPRFDIEKDNDGLLDIDPYLFLGSKSPLLSEENDTAVRLVCFVDVEKEDIRLLLVFDCMLVLCAFSGNPSHFELVGRTKSGSFWEETPGIPTAICRPPFCAAAFFCASAKFSHAAVEGSLSVRKPSNPVFFLLFVEAALTFPVDDPWLFGRCLLRRSSESWDCCD